jgi:glycosyl transferase-like sugar-binding protein
MKRLLFLLCFLLQNFSVSANPIMNLPMQPQQMQNAILQNPQMQSAVLQNFVQAYLAYCLMSYANQFATQQETKFNESDKLSEFIQKAQYKNGFIIENMTNSPANIKITFAKIDNKILVSSRSEIVNIMPFGIYVAENIDEEILFSIGNQNDQFINPKWTEDGFFEFCLENSEDKNYLYQTHEFDFMVDNISEDRASSEEQLQFIQQFNGHLDYIDNIFAKEELTSLDEMNAKKQTLYDQNNFNQIFKNDPNVLDHEEVKIPLITHKIWLTREDKPQDMPKYYIEWCKNSVKHMPVNTGWKHVIWVEDIAKHPAMVEAVKGTDIQVIDLSYLKSPMLCKDEFYKALRANKFGMASDILRYEILLQFGGVYLDTDYEVFHNLKDLNKMYDLYVAQEPMSSFLCNAFIAAKPNHPMIETCLHLIKRNEDHNQMPNYVRDNTDAGFKTIVITGPAMFSLAFHLNAGIDDNTDIAFPPCYIYPFHGDYPNNKIVKPYGPIPNEAFGAHYWETAWMRAEFGSEG